MEPGFLKPGNKRRDLGSRREEATSMEPGFLKPGNRPYPLEQASRLRDFNGARLPEARKRALWTTP